MQYSKCPHCNKDIAVVALATVLTPTDVPLITRTWPGYETKVTAIAPNVQPPTRSYDAGWFEQGDPGDEQRG